MRTALHALAAIGLGFLVALLVTSCKPADARPDSGPCMTPEQIAQMHEEMAALEARLNDHAARLPAIEAAAAESKSDTVLWRRSVRVPMRPCPPLPAATTLRGGRAP
jgi:hypothetical protein